MKHIWDEDDEIITAATVEARTVALTQAVELVMSGDVRLGAVLNKAAEFETWILRGLDK